MAEEPGRRERKKQRTREALVAEAMRLFEQHGYDQTTVAEIAEAADVSTRTFFLHFATKEDVLLAHTRVRVDLGIDVIAGRGPGESPADVLGRAIEEMIVNTWNTDLAGGLAGLRAGLLTSTPAVQARLLQRFLAAHADLTEALLRAYPDELDAIEAATLVGAVVGAVGAAALTSLRRGDPPEQVRDAMSRATALAVRPR
ncbi:TetR/AcrR family transcriptional regulator [Nonomuraea aridisoli]|uniref:TetR/AcrR family transcriptional regulator n=1 Tax=Nonomuraea aridisoli TaxID=2070368 RepID=A0A2W2DV95_9ACTN|nr:TetR/AcrR family transcriptional regulator [Nonomuraea aridisoli]PZG14091.1 TetR/AcrR family transcriptional regulator [Nonomuraea aridisoli]